MFKDLSKLLKNAKVLKDKMGEVQDELSKKSVTVSTGGGMVTVSMNGNQELLSLDIEDAILSNLSKEDKKMLVVLLISAVNEATKQIKEMVSKEISSLSFGLDPKLFKDFE